MRIECISEISKNDKPIAVFEENGVRRFVGLTEDDLPTKYKNMTGEELKELMFNGTNKDIVKSINNIRLTDKYVDDDGTKLYMKNKSLMFLPDFSKERELIYIFGPSGSGKSFLTNRYVKEFKLGRPDYDVFLFTRLEDDPSLEFKFTKIKLEAEVLENIDVESLENSIVIFDDTETPNDKSVSKLVDNLKDLIAQEGRHFNITMIVTTHMACNYNRTRIILNECQKYVIFPRGNGVKQMTNMFCDYGGMSKHQFETVRKLDTRWCMLNTSYPNYIVYQSGIMLT